MVFNNELTKIIIEAYVHYLRKMPRPNNVMMPDSASVPKSSTPFSFSPHWRFPSLPSKFFLFLWKDARAAGGFACLPLQNVPVGGRQEKKAKGDDDDDAATGGKRRKRRKEGFFEKTLLTFALFFVPS